MVCRPEPSIWEYISYHQFSSQRLLSIYKENKKCYIGPWNDIYFLCSQIAESGLNPEEILAAAHKQKGDVTEQFDEGANKISDWLDKTANTLDLQVNWQIDGQYLSKQNMDLYGGNNEPNGIKETGNEIWVYP